MCYIAANKIFFGQTIIMLHRLHDISRCNRRSGSVTNGVQLGFMLIFTLFNFKTGQKSSDDFYFVINLYLNRIPYEFNSTSFMCLYVTLTLNVSENRLNLILIWLNSVLIG